MSKVTIKALRYYEKEKLCICIYYKGPYDTLEKSYAKIMKYIEDNKLEITDFPRECYIEGIWNKENVEDWLTEIQVPIKQKVVIYFDIETVGITENELLGIIEGKTTLFL